MTDFDEGLQEWRYRHIKLVERTIGAKKGTGGSPRGPVSERVIVQAPSFTISGPLDTKCEAVALLKR